MKKIAIIAALAAAIAAPVMAQSTSTAFAIQHFNMDFDSAGDVRQLPSGQNVTSVATNGSSSVATAFDIFNRAQDSSGDLRGLNGATVVGGTPAHAQEIFNQLRAASLEDE